jgi:glycosyltransferase involved in cell wall biosynthesis
MRKILILSPTFFPDPLVGAVRVSQWARHLPEFGWSPLVLCRHRGYTATPQALAEQIHPEVQVQYLGPMMVSPPADAAAAGRRERSMRGTAMRLLDLVSVPDVLIWKWRSLGGEAIARARQWQPDAVLSSSPSHSIHSVGRRVAHATGAAWIADFRDPYLMDCRHQPRGLKRALISLHRKYERDIYRDAALCIHAIPLHSRWASRRYPFARHKIRTLTNGIPAELLNDGFLQSAWEKQAGSPRASIRAVGVLGLGALAVVSAAIQHLLARGMDAEFRHVGFSREGLANVPVELRDRVHLLGAVGHADALREIAGADVLLKFDDRERASANLLSSKLFEYLATGKPIVAVNPTRPDWQLVGRLPWCQTLVDPGPGELADALHRAIRGPARPAEAWLSAFRRRYSRRWQTEELAGWLNQLLVRHGSGSIWVAGAERSTAPV